MKAKFTPIVHTYRDIDERPFPDYEPFGMTEMVDDFSMATRLLYRYSRPDARPFMIVTARGCPFSCTFCVKHPSKYRTRSIPNIMSEIAVMYDKYKFNVLIIDDELFAVNKERMRRFCTVLKKNRKTFGWDFDWMFQTHANSKLDLETLKLAKEAGCYVFSYGIESLSPTILESMNKKSTPSQIEEAVDLASEVGIAFAGNLLFGDPAETEKTICESLEFYFRYGLDCFIFLSLVQPYPGSALFDYCLENGIIADKESYYENIGTQFFHTTQMDEWNQWASMLLSMETAHIGMRMVDSYKVEHEDDPTKLGSHNGRITNVHGICPFCGGEVHFRGHMGNAPYTVTGCNSCNKRVRVNI